MLVDEGLLEGITRVTCSILQNSFFYSTEAIKRFLDAYFDRFLAEYIKFEETVDDDTCKNLLEDKLSRKHFTSYFASYQLHETLTLDCHFDEFELRLFENLLPRYTGGNDNEFKPKKQGKNHRKFSL
jgi:sulfatase maturation enzyme AslB (radical SAM superfamily)